MYKNRGCCFSRCLAPSCQSGSCVDLGGSASPSFTTPGSAQPVGAISEKSHRFPKIVPVSRNPLSSCRILRVKPDRRIGFRQRDPQPNETRAARREHQAKRSPGRHRERMSLAAGASDPLLRECAARSRVAPDFACASLAFQDLRPGSRAHSAAACSATFCWVAWGVASTGIRQWKVASLHSPPVPSRQ